LIYSRGGLYIAGAAVDGEGARVHGVSALYGGCHPAVADADGYPSHVRPAKEHMICVCMLANSNRQVGLLTGKCQCFN
jgi:hypothetical protein